MLKIMPVKAFKDNYIWCLVNLNNKNCVVVDPGDAQPVINFLTHNQFNLTAVLITHHHWDHTGGIDELHENYGMPIYGPTNDTVSYVDFKLSEGAKIYLDTINLKLNVMDIPGHTKGHIAFYSDEFLWCGDTLFSAGCGRVFEGTYAQMFESLQKITSLAPETLIYCAHEYTEANLKFASTVEPDNLAIHKRINAVKELRKQDLPTLPTTLTIERLTNPFLRCHESSVIHAVKQRHPEIVVTPLNVFQALREWKNNF